MKLPWYMKSEDGINIKFHWLWVLYQIIKFKIMKTRTTLIIISSSITVAGLLWYAYLNFFTYFDVLMSAQDRLIAFWKPALLIIVGVVVLNIVKYKK